MICETLSSAFPTGFHVDQAAAVAIAAVADALDRHPQIELVRFVLFGDEIYAAFERALTESGRE